MVIIQKDFKKHSVRVHPFKPDDKECVAYDLHVGRFFLDPGKERNRPMPDEFKLRLQVRIFLYFRRVQQRIL